MSPYFNTLVIGLSIGALALFAWDAILGKWIRAVTGIFLLAAFLFVLNLLTGFPLPARGGQIAFGAGIPTTWGVVVMFCGILLGCIAAGIWNPQKPFSWLVFVRPLVISPILLLPLLASLPPEEIQPIQLTALAILAFQNGFFWQQVLKDAKPLTASGHISSGG